MPLPLLQLPGHSPWPFDRPVGLSFAVRVVDGLPLSCAGVRRQWSQVARPKEAPRSCSYEGSQRRGIQEHGGRLGGTPYLILLHNGILNFLPKSASDSLRDPVFVVATLWRLTRVPCSRMCWELHLPRPIPLAGRVAFAQADPGCRVADEVSARAVWRPGADAVQVSSLALKVSHSPANGFEPRLPRPTIVRLVCGMRRPTPGVSTRGGELGPSSLCCPDGCHCGSRLVELNAAIFLRWPNSTILARPSSAPRRSCLDARFAENSAAQSPLPGSFGSSRVLCRRNTAVPPGQRHQRLRQRASEGLQCRVLRDRKGHEFPVRTDVAGRSHVDILVPLDLSLSLPEVAGMRECPHCALDLEVEPPSKRFRRGDSRSGAIGAEQRPSVSDREATYKMSFHNIGSLSTRALLLNRLIVGVFAIAP